MFAADRLLIPALAADLDVRGAGKLYDLVAGELPDLQILGVLLAASERRWRITRELRRMTPTRCGCCRSTYRGRSGWLPRRATAPRPRCSSPTRWSATPTASSPNTCSGSWGDEPIPGDPAARRRPIPGMAAHRTAAAGARDRRGPDSDAAAPRTGERSRRPVVGSRRPSIGPAADELRPAGAARRAADYATRGW